MATRIAMGSLRRAVVGRPLRRASTAFQPPSGPKFLCRSIGKVLGMNIITSNITPLHGYGRCEQIFTLFFRFNMKLDPKHSTAAPRGEPGAQSFHGTSQ